MKKSRLIGSLCALFFSFFCGQALAAASWGDGPFKRLFNNGENNIDEIVQNVTDIREDVGGNAKDVAANFKNDLNDLANRGFILRESVEELLDWLQSRVEPYLTFVGGLGEDKCHLNSPCNKFKIELNTFFLEIADQRFNFPVIERSGLGDGTRAEKIIMNTPPIILFGLYEVMDRMPDWKGMPANLQSIFDEIGDRDVFSMRLNKDEENTIGISVKTPTQRFCERWENRVDKEMDPIRANRIELFVYQITKLLDLVEKLTSPTIGVTLVGEGNETLIPNPLKAQMALITYILDVTKKSVTTLRDNLGVCRANRRVLEIQIAECLDLVDFILPSKRDDIYNLVKTKVENAGDESIPVAISQKHIASAEVFREKGKWKKAYKKLCVAYKRIGDD